MKKLLYSTLAIAAILAASCSREVSKDDNPVSTLETSTHEVIYKGVINPATRTAYANDKTFSWLEGESVLVLTAPIDETVEDQYFHGTYFKGDVAGPVTNFKGQVGDGQEVWFALYPDYGQLFVNDDIATYLPPSIFVDSDDDEHYYTVSSSNPLSNLPLIGIPDATNETLQFHTAAGAAKFTISGLEPGLKLIRIYSSEEKLSGYFTFDNGFFTNSSALPGKYSVQDGSQVDCSRYFVQYLVNTDAEGTATFYATLPVGKISAGSQLMVYDYDLETDNGSLSFSKVIPKDIDIVANAVTVLAPLEVGDPDWENIGTGKFIDNYLWKMFGFPAGEYVDVVITRDANDKTHYRMENPFTKAAAKFNFTNEGEATADDYFDFSVLPNGKVLYDEVYTGLYYNSGYDPGDGIVKDALSYVYPGLFSNTDYSRNIVVEFQEDGATPACIQLDPIFYLEEAGGYWSWFTAGEENGLHIIGTKSGNNIATILFPGQTKTYDLELSVDYTGESVVNEPGTVTATVMMGTDILEAKLVAAKDESSAMEAFMSGANVATITSSDTDIRVSIPANAETGVYFVYVYSSLLTEGLTDVSHQILAAEQNFSYFNPEDPDKYSLEDIIGTWETSTASLYYNGWNYNQDCPLVVEESDDEDSGNVMITQLYWDDVFDSPLYMNFDTQTGIMSGYPGPTTKLNTQFDGGWVDDDDPSAELFFFLEDNGTLTYQHGDGFLDFCAFDPRSGNFLGYFGYYLTDIVLTKSETNSAPANNASRAPKKGNCVEIDSVAETTLSTAIAPEKPNFEHKAQQQMFVKDAREDARKVKVNNFGYGIRK